MSVAFPPMKRPLVAILRGVRPEEVEAIVGVLIDAGMTAIEIPLNSPDPFRSIAMAVKQALTGYGHADKRQIHAMVRVLLPKADPPSDDAADALAIAITHAHHRKARALAV